MLNMMRSLHHITIHPELHCKGFHSIPVSPFKRKGVKEWSGLLLLLEEEGKELSLFLETNAKGHCKQSIEHSCLENVNAP